MKKFVNNCFIYILRKTIVFLIKILDKLRVKKGQGSYTIDYGIGGPGCYNVKKVAQNAYGVFINNKSIGTYFNKQFRQSDHCLFDPEIEAYICKQWLYSSIVNMEEYKYIAECIDKMNLTETIRKCQNFDYKTGKCRFYNSGDTECIGILIGKCKSYNTYKNS